MKVLGIESSCDETAAAVVEDGCRLLSNVVASSVDLHAAYGGVVPEIAARSHLESITPVIEAALTQAGCNWHDIDAIAVTQGPGLIGSLLIGVMSARTLAIAKNKPLYAVNHVEAHPYAAFLVKSSLAGYKLPLCPPQFPTLALIVSGGHTQLVLFRGHGQYQLVGQTTDDAIGEAFDKVAKLLGLPYPGGPSVAEAAKQGDPKAYKLPRAKLDNPFNFSFSGLKTAVLRQAQAAAGRDYTLPSTELPGLLTGRQKADLAASFQETALLTVVDALAKAADKYQPSSIIIAGGVAANQELRRLADGALPLAPIYPDIKLCTDNAAMVAARAGFMTTAEQVDPYELAVSPILSM